MTRPTNMSSQEQEVQNTVLEALSKARAPRSTAAVVRWLGLRSVDRTAAKRALWNLLDSRDLDVTSDLRLFVPRDRYAHRQPEDELVSR